MTKGQGGVLKENNARKTNGPGTNTKPGPGSCGQAKSYVTIVPVAAGSTIDQGHRKQRKQRSTGLDSSGGGGGGLGMESVDYRDYFRPRGEYLTRGAALASQDYAGTPVGSARGSLASHLDSIGMTSTNGQGNVVYSVGQRGGIPGSSGIINAGEQVAMERADLRNRYAGASGGAGPGGAPMSTVGVSRLQAAGGKEKYGERRNPTILRKSK